MMRMTDVLELEGGEYKNENEELISQNTYKVLLDPTDGLLHRIGL